MALTLMFMVLTADAHPAPFSYLDVHLDATSVRGSIVMHDFDVAHELGLEEPATLLDLAAARAKRQRLVMLVDERLSVHIDGTAVRPMWDSIDVLPARQSVRLSFTVDRPARALLEVDAVLFPYDAKHQTFVNIYESGDLKQQSILDDTHHTSRFYRANVQGRWAVVSTYVQSGLHHIVIGPDHILFLVGLLLLGGSWQRLAAIVTAFTAGHSITLSLAALNVVHVPSSIVEPAIALSIIVVGTDNLLVRRDHRAKQAKSARDLRPWMAGIFGLIHGFGFAAVLREVGLPHDALGWSLAAFNIGVEIGQLLIVFALLGLARLAGLIPTLRAQHAERFFTLTSMAIIAAGVYWLTQRIWLTAL